MPDPAHQERPHLDRSGRPTLATVAALAGVHVSTVSRALSGSVGSNVRVGSAETVDRIRRVAADVGFSRNIYAAGLRTHQTALVGMLVPRLTDLVLATVYEGVEEEARRSGYQTFVTNTRDEDGERRRKLDMFLARRVEGILLGDARMDADEVVERLQALQVPYVLLSRRAPGHPSVTCDDREGGRLAARHLLSLGHRVVAVIAGEQYASTARDRLAGFAEVFAEAGHPRAPRLVVPSGFDVASGRRACDHILGLPGAAPTGVFAVNDFAAIGALGSLRQRAGSRGVTRLSSASTTHPSRGSCRSRCPRSGHRCTTGHPGDGHACAEAGGGGHEPRAADTLTAGPGEHSGDGIARVSRARVGPEGPQAAVATRRRTPQMVTCLGPALGWSPAG